MFRRSWLLILSLGVGLAIGLMMNRHSSLESAHAQGTPHSAQSAKILVQGHGVAISSEEPPGGQFTLTASNAPRTAFKIVPEGKKLILTDVMYQTQQTVRQELTVNIADANPSDHTHDILFQINLEPGKSDQVHLCTGYVIPAGNAVVAFTNAGLAPEQYISVSVTGYLTDQ